MAFCQLPIMFSLRFSPRFNDLDSYGHVNNAVYATYFEILRTEWIKTVAWDQIVSTNPSIGFVIARLEIDFLSPIFFEHVIDGRMWVCKIGNKSWEFEYILSNAVTGEEFARGKTVQVLIDRKRRQAIELTDDTRRVLTNYIIQDA